MRAMSLAAASIAVLGLAACATTGERSSTWSQELAALTQECADRGGILSPIVGAPGHEVRSSYTCDIRGGASRLD